METEMETGIETTTIPKSNWGKGWTYLLLAIFFAAITSTIWVLVEKRRDANAEIFFEVAKDNFKQVYTVYTFVKAMPDSQHKTALLEILKEIKIVTTRGEVDSIAKLKKIRDSIANDSINKDTTIVGNPDLDPSKVWVIGSINSYSPPNAANPISEQANTNGWVGINGGMLSVTGNKLAGSSAIEIDGSSTIGSGAQQPISLIATKKYGLTVNLKRNNEIPSKIEIVSGTTVIESKSILSGDNAVNNGYLPYDFTVENFGTIIIRITFDAPSANGKEIYVDSIALREYVLQ